MRPLQLNVIAGDPSDTAVYSQDYYIHQGYRGENRLRFWISSRFPTAPIRININNDAVDDLDQRTFTLKVLAPSVTITNSIDYERRPSSIWEIDTGAYESLKRTNPAPVFLPGEGVDEAGLVWTGTVTITDNDGPPTVSLSTPLTARVIEVAEGEAGITNQVEVPVQLGLVSRKTTSIGYTTQDGTAIAGQDYTETSGTLTFPAGVTNQTITIPILGDALDEPDESFNVILLNPTNSVLQPKTVRIEIIDDDEPAPPVNVNIGGAVVPIITPFPSQNDGLSAKSLMFKTTSLSLSESGSATYQVRATSSQEREMVVNLATSHPGITVNPNRLVFNQNTWQSYQTVTVTASSDAADTNERATIRHSIPESLGFVAINDAGIVSVAIAHTIVEEEETPEPEPREQAPIVQLPPTDYDLDDDGLIDVSHLAQLHALRFDLNGDGQPDKEEFADDYSQAFPSAIDNTKAQGYELAGDLDFGDNPTSWESIGLFSQPFQAVFEGNGHVLSNLFQDQRDPALFADEPSGLFGAVGHRAQVIHVVLEGVEIRGVNWVGALAGLSQGVLVNCSVRGRVVGYNSVGGLVGHNFGEIADSHVRGEVRGETSVGGLVGWNVGGLIEGSSALGQETLGLVGFGTPAVR